MGKLKKMLIAVLIFCVTVSSVSAENPTTQLNGNQLPNFPKKLTGYAIGESNQALILAGGKIKKELNRKVFVLLPNSKIWQNFEGKYTFDNVSYTSDGKSLYIAEKINSKNRVFRITWKNNKINETLLTSIPSELSDYNIAVLRDRLYALGKGQNNFYSLDLTKKEANWQKETNCPVEGISDPVLAVQSYALLLLSEKIDGKLSNIAWVFRAKPSDDAIKDKGWKKIANPPVALKSNSSLASGQAHVVSVNGKDLYIYHVITDAWYKDTSLKNLTDATVISNAIGWNRGLVIIPSKLDENLVFAKFKPLEEHIHFLDYLIIIGYIVFAILIGIYFARKEKSSEDFFLGGRKIPWWAAGLSLYATSTSSIGFMATPIKNFCTNMVYAWGNFINPIAQMLIAGLIFIPIIRRLNVTTTFEYLQTRFCTSLRLLGSFLGISFQLAGRMSVVLLLPSFAISAITGIDVVVCVAIMGIVATIYTTLGGLAAVIWTDVIQFFVVMGSIFFALILLILNTDGGFSGFISLSMDYNKFRAFDLAFDWTSPVIWIFILTAIIGSGTVINDQVMVQRVLATPSVKEARRSYIMLCLITLPFDLVFAVLGIALFTYYHSHPSNLNPVMQNIQTLPLYIVNGLPVGVTGLLLAGILAATMSTLDSGMSSVSTMLVNDFYKRFYKKATDEKCLRLGKWLTAVIGFASTGVAMIMATWQIDSFFDLWKQLVALIGGGFGGLFILGIFTKRGNYIGAWAGAVASIFATIYMKKYTNIHFMAYAVLAIICCVVVGYIVSLFFPGKNTEENLKGLTIYTLKNRDEI